MSKYEILLNLRKTHSVTKTANELSYTPSAVSQVVKNYENNLGIKLFNKTKNGMEESPAATAILDSIEEICIQEKRIADTATRINHLRHGHIRIGTIQSISYHWLPQILAEMNREYPDLTFEVYVDGFDQLTRKLNDFELECIFTAEYSVPDCSFVPMARDELLLVTPRDSDVSSRISVSVDYLQDQDFILSSDGLSYETGELFRSRNIHTKGAFKINEDYCTLKMVEAGLGMAILPKLLLQDAPFDVCIRPFTEHYNRVLGIAYRKGEEVTPALEKLIEISQEWARNKGL